MSYYYYYDDEAVTDDTEYVEEDTGVAPLGQTIWPAAPALSLVSGILNYMTYSDVSLGVASYWKPVIISEFAAVLPLALNFAMPDMWFNLVIADTVFQAAGLFLTLRANSNLSYSPANDGVLTSILAHFLGFAVDGFAIYTDMTYDWCSNGYADRCAADDYYGEEDSYAAEGYYGYY